MLCIAKTKKGENCRNKSKEGSYCGIHKKSETVESPESQNISEQKTEITNITEFQLDVKKLGMQIVFRDTENKLALLIGKFNNPNLIISAYQSIAGDMLVNPPVKSRFSTESKQNRSVGFTSNESLGYKYSGQIMSSIKLSDANKQLLEYVNSYLGSDYNGILWNRYSGGTDYLSEHSDDEKSLGNTGVFSITIWLEAPAETSRTFRIRNKPLEKDTKLFKRTTDQIDLIFENNEIKTFRDKDIVLDLELGHLDTCLMYGDFQKYLEHSVPKRLKVKYTRVSATFRKHLE